MDENVPHNCPGVESEEAGKQAPCAGCPNQKLCASGEARVPDPDIELIVKRIDSSIENVIFVMSGKGGVGKSTVSVNLAAALSGDSHQVGILDADLCGPSIATMLGCEGEQVQSTMSGWSPVSALEGKVSVISTAFLKDKDGAVIMRGPKKYNLLKQFLKEVDWSFEPFKYLIVDTPPGTSDEHLTLAQLLKGCQSVKGAVFVSTPQEIALLDVRKQINFCKKINMPLLGVIENMSGLVCPNCDKTNDLFQATTGGVQKMCKEMDVPYLGAIPMEPSIMFCADSGVPFVDSSPMSKSTLALLAIRDCVLKQI